MSAALLLFFYSEKRYFYLKTALSLCLITVAIAFIAPVEWVFAGITLPEWSQITGIAVGLVFLANFIRELKPPYTRYPSVFIYTPLIPIFLFPFISDAEILKRLLNQILQAGALAITLLLYIPLSKKLTNHFYYLAAVLLLIATYGLFWFSGDQLPDWSWHLTFVAGILIGSYSLNRLLNTLSYS